MTDLSNVDGGRRSRRSRGSADIRQSSGTQFRSRDFARAVETPEGFGRADALNALAGAIGSFFPALNKVSEIAEREGVLNAQEENRAEITRMEAMVRGASREEVKQAIRDQDFSKFIRPEFQTRKVILDATNAVFAQKSAFEDAEELKNAIRSTPFDSDPTAVVKEFVDKELEGMPPIAALAYQDTVEDVVRPEIKAFQKSRLAFQQRQAEVRGRSVIRDTIRTNQIPPTADGLDAIRRQLIATMPRSAPEAVLRADAIVDDTILNMAAQGDARALKMAQVVDDKRGGTSILDRNREAYDKAVQAFIKKQEQFQTVDALGNMQSLEERFDKIKAGRPDEGDSLAALWVDVSLHGQNHGQTGKRFRGLRRAIATAVGVEGSRRGNMDLIAQGKAINMSTREWNKVAPAAYDGSLAKEIASRNGLSEQLAQTRVLQAVAERGSGPEMRTQNSNILLNSSDPSVVQDRVQVLAEIDASSDRDMSDHIEGEEAVALYHGMRGVMKATGNVQEVINFRDKFNEARSKTDADPSRHFESRPLALTGNDAGKTQGQKGALAAASKVWDWINKTDASLETPGVLGFNTDEDFDDLSPAVREQLVRSVNLASFVLSDQNASHDQIFKLAASLNKGRFGLEMGSDGNPRITLDQTPRIATGADGRPMPGSKVTLDVIDGAKQDFTKPAAQRVAAAVGGIGGLAQDRLTAQGGGLAVRSTAAGFPKDVSMVPGTRFTIPASQIEGAPEAKFFTAINIDKKSDAATLGVPAAPGPGEPTRKPLTDNLFMMYDPGVGAWRLRYQEAPVKQGTSKPKTISDLGEENQASAKAQAARARGDLAGLTEDELRRAALGGRRGAAAEIRRRRLEGRAGVGAPVVSDDATGPMTDEEAAGVTEIEDAVMEEFTSRGVVDPNTKLTIGTEGDIVDRTDAALLKAKSDGGWLDDNTKPDDERLMAKVADTIADFEGRVPFAYDDHTGRKWTQNGKGDPTVGIGFNLNRPDAGQILAELGIKKADVLSGDVVLTDDQQDALLELAMRETTTWLRNHFKDVDMENHRWVALTSLAYNSRWNNRGPTLVGPKITKAIKEGRWEDAALEIEKNSSGGVPKRLLSGILARRRKEADLFRGVSL